MLGWAMLCGILGCFCYGGGDWLMMYGDPAHSGSLFWLTQGVAHLSTWRNVLVFFMIFFFLLIWIVGARTLAQRE